MVGRAPSKEVSGPDRLQIGTVDNTFSKMPGARPVWKCCVVEGIRGGTKAQYLFKLLDLWVVAVGPAKVANYAAFRKVQLARRELNIQWTSSEDIVENIMPHQWTPFIAQRRWACAPLSTMRLACNTTHLLNTT